MGHTTTQYIEIRANRDGQPRAFIVGTRIRVQDIYFLSEAERKSPDEIVAVYPHLSLGQIHAALSYYFDHRDEILQEIRQDNEFVAKMRTQLGPGPLERKRGGLADSEDDAISSG